MTFAICRIQKIKTWGQLKTHEAHTIRTRNTPNANPEIENTPLIETDNNQDLVTLTREKIGSQKIRSNAVIAVEMLLSASAKYFRPYEPNEGGSYDKHRLDNFVDAVIPWLHNSWGNRIVRADLHLDEMTPHIHAFLVPLDEWGKLNCKALFGNRSKMYDLQDSFAAAVAHLGIIRGIRGSVATHEQIRKYYAAINQDSQVLDLERCLPQPQPKETGDSYRQRIIEVLNPQLEVINYQLSERNRILRQIAELKQTALKSEQLRQQLERELKTLRITGIQRNLPIAVGEILLPVHSPQNWQKIEHYLVQKRCIPQKLLKILHQRSLVYADIRGNAVFVTRNLSNEPTGAYLYKPFDCDRFMLHPDSKRDYGWFHLSMGGHVREPTTQAILVSSPIEALSLIVLKAPHKHKTMYLVCDFQAQLPLEFLKNLPSVIVAMNRERLSSIDKFLSNIPNIKFLDTKITWNQQLQKQRGKTHAALAI